MRSPATALEALISRLDKAQRELRNEQRKLAIEAVNRAARSWVEAQTAAELHARVRKLFKRCASSQAPQRYGDHIAVTDSTCQNVKVEEVPLFSRPQEVFFFLQ